MENIVSRFVKFVDVAATVGTLGLCVIGKDSARYVGGAIALWQFGRAAHCLWVKHQHNESLTDLESCTLWISIATTPLTGLSALSNARLVAGAIEGQIFSSNYKIFATVLNCATVAVHGVPVACGILNLIEKINNGQLDTLDVLQISMIVFFFTHTLIQPISAETIIRNAQRQRIDSISSQITDAKAKVAYEKFSKENRGDMTADAIVIRFLNNVDNPEFFFKAKSDATSMKIGGKNGRTILVTHAGDRTTQIDPNSTISMSEPQKGWFEENISPQITFNNCAIGAVVVVFGAGTLYCVYYGVPIFINIGTINFLPILSC